MAQEKEVVLMKGNEAIAHAAIRCGCDGYFGYPITPQSEVIETLAELKPWETTGMQVVQAESELASIYMVYGAAGAGKRAMTSSSSPGIALMQEGITYMVSTFSVAVPVWELSNLRRVTISRLRAVVVTATTRLSYWLHHLYRRWPTSLTWHSSWHSSIATLP